MMQDSNHWAKSSPAHPKDSQWNSRLDSVVWKLCLVLPETWSREHGTTWSFSLFESSAEFGLWTHNAAELRPDQLQQAQIIDCPHRLFSRLMIVLHFFPWCSRSTVLVFNNALDSSEHDFSSPSDLKCFVSLMPRIWPFWNRRTSFPRPPDVPLLNKREAAHCVGSCCCWNMQPLSSRRLLLICLNSSWWLFLVYKKLQFNHRL